MKRRILFPLVTVVLLGCASNLATEMALDVYLPGKDYSDGLSELEKNREKFGERNELLYLLNKGTLLFYSDRYTESNQFFMRANALAEELYTKSISTEAGALINPNLTPYDGEDYEKVMINVFMAFNYICLGQLEEAGVEARIIDQKLKVLSRKYEAENKYRSDAFGRYLSGLIYEAQGDMNNAYISYKLAYQAYNDYREMLGLGIPDQIGADILRLAKRLGFEDQYEDYRKEFGLENGVEERTREEVILIAMVGLSPVKREIKATLTRVDGEGKTHTFQLLVPELVQRPDGISGVYAGTIADSKEKFERAELAQDISSIAMKNMSDKMPSIMVKAWLRALAKYRVTEEAKEKMDTSNWLANLLVGGLTDQIAEEMTHADIRCWRTLPSKIYLKRFNTAPGSYDVGVDFTGEHGEVIEKRIMEDVKVLEGRKTFVFTEKFD